MPRRRSRGADFGDLGTRRSRRAGAVPTAFALARSAKPDGAVAAPGLGQRLPVDDDGARRRATALISNSFRRRLKSKERKLQPLPGYRYHVATTEAEIKRLLDGSSASSRCGCVEQKLPNVFAESGVEDFIRAACMTPLAAADARSISTPGMRRRSDRDFRRRRRRQPLFDDVQYLHDVGELAIQPRTDPDAQHHRSLCRSKTIAPSTSASDRTNTSGCSARTTSRSSTALFRSACAAGWPPARCRPQPRQAAGEAQSGAASRSRRTCAACSSETPSERHASEAR